MADLKMSDMTQQELEYFIFLCNKFEVQVSSTEGLREVIKVTRKGIDEQEKEWARQLQETKKMLNECEKMLSNLEKGGLRK